MTRRHHQGDQFRQPRELRQFPSTEYLTIDLTDFLCFNTYLHEESAFHRYVSRLHNLAADGLVCTENHGGENRLLQIRGNMRLSQLSASLPRHRSIVDRGSFAELMQQRDGFAELYDTQFLDSPKTSENRVATSSQPS